MPDTLYLVDGSGFIHRAYHALPPLTTRRGVPSGAVYGFTQMLMKLELDYKPSHLAVVLDAGKRSFRNDLFPAYKANRVEPPDDLRPQFGLVREVVDAFGVPRLESTEMEADDLIAALVRRAREAGMPVVIVSSDKDLMQLVEEPEVVLLDTMKDPPKTYDTAGVVEKLGVPPSQVRDLLALMGDSVDNIPGVRGVGPKTACALIQHFGSLDEMYRRLDEVGQLKTLRGAASVMAKLREAEGDARMSQRLVSLDASADPGVDIEALRRKEPDFARVEECLRALEFGRLIDRLRAAGKGGPAATADATLPLPIPAVPTPAAAPAVALVEGAPTIVLDEKSLADVVARLRAGGEVGLGVELAGGSTLTGALVGIALAGPGLAAYVPVGHRYLGAPAQLPLQRALDGLRPLLADAAVKKSVPDAKDVELVLARHGVALAGVACDPLVASYLLDTTEAHDLPALAARRLGAAVPARAELTGTGKRALPFDTVEVERAAAYAARAADAARALAAPLLDELDHRQMRHLLDGLELPLAHVLAVIERHGVRLDVAWLRTLSDRVDKQLTEIETEVRAQAVEAAGPAFADLNLGSPKQLQELLFDKLGLPPQKRTKTGYSVDADTLEELAPLHPVAARIAEHRTLAKLKGTYLDALPLLVDQKTGRLHTSYRQTIAATGRLSSVEPNLQNVPIRTPFGAEIRKAFIAEEGWRLVVGDYSQIELRVLAHLSKDDVLLDSFRRGEDIHERTVVEMFGADRRHDKALRSVAKMINYGIAYGLSDFGLAQRLGIERDKAKEYIDGYLRTYRGVAAYMDGLVADAYRDGGARTMFGRFRPIPELKQKARMVRMQGERMAKNTPIQGTAADILKYAMIAVQRMLDERTASTGSRARMLLTVHDELVLEAPEAEADEVGAALRRAMEGAVALDVPLVVDLGVGRTWSDAK